MTETQHKRVISAERGIFNSMEFFNGTLKEAFLGETVETQVGRHTVRCKVIDAEDGKLVLDNGARREWRNVEPIVICDRQDEAQRHEVGEASKEKV